MVTMNSDIWEQIKKHVVKLFLRKQQGAYSADEEHAAIVEIVESLRALGRPDDWNWNFGDFKTHSLSGRYLAVEFNHHYIPCDGVRLKYGMLFITLPEGDSKLAYTFSK